MSLNFRHPIPRSGKPIKKKPRSKRPARLTLAKLRQLTRTESWCVCLTCEAIRNHGA